MKATNEEKLRKHIRSLRLSYESLDYFLGKYSGVEIDALCDFAAHELDLRARKRQERMLKAARFPKLKSLENFSFEHIVFPEGFNKDELLSLGFIDFAQDFIFYGQTGRGKTHLAIALGVKAINEGKSVSFYTAADLVMALSKAKRENRLERLIEQLKKQDLLILDEIGYVPFDIDGARLLYQVICNSYERQSIIFTTNIEFSKWGMIFADEKMTSSLVDRIIHHGRLLEFRGQSRRIEEALMLNAGKR